MRSKKVQSTIDFKKEAQQFLLQVQRMVAIGQKLVDHEKTVTYADPVSERRREETIWSIESEGEELLRLAKALGNTGRINKAALRLRDVLVWYPGYIFRLDPTTAEYRQIQSIAKRLSNRLPLLVSAAPYRPGKPVSKLAALVGREVMVADKIVQSLRNDIYMNDIVEHAVSYVPGSLESLATELRRSAAGLQVGNSASLIKREIEYLRRAMIDMDKYRSKQEAIIARSNANRKPGEVGDSTFDAALFDTAKKRLQAIVQRLERYATMEG